MDRKALGKGISALIPEKEEGRQESILLVAPAQIRPNSLQPREDFDQASIQDLAQSIKEKGVIQPLVVRRHGDAYELIAGERRLRAAQSLGLAQVPVIVRDVDDRDALELALIENLQRENLNPIEEARAYQYLIEKFSLTQERLSEVLGKARASIANSLRLLKLPQEIQSEMRKGTISFAQGRTLLELDDTNQQRRMALDIIAKDLSVRELENLVRARRPRRVRRLGGPTAQDPYVAVIEEDLRHRLGTKVRIVRKKKRGTIEIEFYSPQDLERIVATIKEGIHP